MIWFTSDLHFGHANVLTFSDRPWDDINHMNTAIIANINSLVNTNDHLYILGDFSFKITAEDAAALRSKIRCKNVHLIPGNHDKDWSQPAVADTFILEPPIVVIKDCGQKYVLSHYPLADWQSMSHGSIHLHGHIHSQDKDYNEANRMQGLYRYDVGVDANQYMPVSMAQILSWFSNVEHVGRVKWPEWVNATNNAKTADFAETYIALHPEQVHKSASELQGERRATVSERYEAWERANKSKQEKLRVEDSNALNLSPSSNESEQ